MNATDLDFGIQIGHDLKAASALHAPPVGMYPRVATRRRQLDRRRAGYRAGALGLAAVATVGGVTWTQINRSPARTTTGQRDNTPTALDPSPNPDRIDAYPIVDSLRFGASYGVTTTDQGWSGTLGIPHPDGTPTSMIGIRAFPSIGWDPSMFPTTEGRVAGVREEVLANGMTRLLWNVGAQPMSVLGDDLDLMYDLIPIIKPITPTETRGGYTFLGSLPGGLVEIEPPYNLVPIATPMVDANDEAGTFVATVLHGPVLNTILGEVVGPIEPITINGRNGYRTTAAGAATIVLALSTDETLYIHSEAIPIANLVALAKLITITDRATWEAHYNLTGQQVGPTTSLVD